MAYAVIEKSGCIERKGNVRLRLDFFLEPDDPRYKDTLIQGKATPFHSHFIYLAPDFTDEDVKAEIDFHLPNFYKAFQDKWDKVNGGMRHGWATERRITPSDYSLNTKRVIQCQDRVQKLTLLSHKSEGEGKEYPATVIDIGPGATDRGSTGAAGSTYFDLANTANATGELDTFEVWAATDMSGTNKVGTVFFAYIDYGIYYYNTRDYETIGTITSGAKRTFTGLSIHVHTGEYAAIYFSAGTIELGTSGGSGVLYKAGDQFGAGDQVYTTLANYVISVYGTGFTAPTVTTNDATNPGATTYTTGGNITVSEGSCSVRGVKYGLTSGSRTWTNSEAGSFGTGSFDRDLTGLSAGTLYYYEAFATNIAGTGYGSEKTLLTLLAAPTDFVLESGKVSGRISLSWTKGAGAYATYIRGKIGSYPTGTTDGIEVYSGIGTSVNHNGLTGGDVWYYRAWSYLVPNYSSDYAQDYETAFESPVSITQPASDINKTSVRINGKISDDGGATCEGRFRYREYRAFPYTFPFEFLPEWTYTTWQNSLVTDSTFYEDLVGLDVDTDYEFQTQARNSIGTEEQTSDNVDMSLLGIGIVRAGQYLIIPNVAIAKLSFKLAKYGSPTGNITFTIRKVSDDSIINSKVLEDASALTTTPTWYEVVFETPVLTNEAARILAEFSGGSANNYVLVRHQSSDVKADENETYYIASYTAVTGYDCTYSYEYYLIGDWSASAYFTTLAYAVIDISGILNGIGLITSQSEVDVLASGGINGQGSIPSEALLDILNAGVLSGIGTILSSAIATPPFEIIDISGIFSGIGLITSSSMLIISNEGEISGEGLILSSTLSDIPVSALIEGIGSILSEGLLIIPTSGIISGEGLILSSAGGLNIIGGLISGEGLITSSGKLLIPSGGQVYGEGEFLSNGNLIIPSGGLIIGEGDIFSDAYLIVLSQGEVVGIGVILSEGGVGAAVILIGGLIDGVGIILANGEVWHCQPIVVPITRLSPVRVPISQVPLKRIPVSQLSPKRVPVSRLLPKRTPITKVPLKETPKSEVPLCRKVKQ
ncbi:MAG: polymer-forming cytoskeletal protein [Dehalococcoidia bacterium]|nr:polymer-forming cytoskeletal protein [Dehalococcoidia bacterium]